RKRKRKNLDTTCTQAQNLEIGTVTKSLAVNFLNCKEIIYFIVKFDRKCLFRLRHKSRYVTALLKIPNCEAILWIQMPEENFL
ncbi:23035_t:CDS:1, partial [Racocetra persica]